MFSLGIIRWLNSKEQLRKNREDEKPAKKKRIVKKKRKPDYAP